MNLQAWIRCFPAPFFIHLSVQQFASIAMIAYEQTSALRKQHASKAVLRKSLRQKLDKHCRNSEERYDEANGKQHMSSPIVADFLVGATLYRGDRFMPRSYEPTAAVFWFHRKHLALAQVPGIGSLILSNRYHHETLHHSSGKADNRCNSRADHPRSS